jgi:hypothetical protein
MSLRERWIVYPLLFLTLGIALRDKVIPPSHFGNFHMNFEAGTVVAPRIRCNELVCDRVKSNQSQCNMMFITGPNGQPVVAAGTDSKGRAGMLETFTTDGQSQVRLLSSAIGGIVSTVERNGKLMLILGDTGENFGVFADLPNLGKLIPLTLPWPFENAPPKPQSSKKSGSQNTPSMPKPGK